MFPNPRLHRFDLQTVNITLVLYRTGEKSETSRLVVRRLRSPQTPLGGLLKENPGPKALFREKENFAIVATNPEKDESALGRGS